MDNALALMAGKYKQLEKYVSTYNALTKQSLAKLDECEKAENAEAKEA